MKELTDVNILMYVASYTFEYNVVVFLCDIVLSVSMQAICSRFETEVHQVYILFQILCITFRVWAINSSAKHILLNFILFLPLK